MFMAVSKQNSGWRCRSRHASSDRHSRVALRARSRSVRSASVHANSWSQTCAQQARDHILPLLTADRMPKPKRCAAGAGRVWDWTRRTPRMGVFSPGSLGM